MSKRTLKLLAAPATVGFVVIAALAGAIMPKTMVPWAIIGGTCLVWIVGLVIGRTYGSAPGWSLWALGSALGAGLATTGLIPNHGLTFAGAALLVVVAAILVAKSIADAIEARYSQH